MQYQTERLPNGIGLAVAPMPQVESVSVGLWLGVGGRHEPEELGGISHYIEHLLFKGTRRRSAREISEAVEGVGGYLNAFTAEEMTCYFAKASAKHLPILIDVLVDMLVGATFPTDEIERERGVITEEIKMYEDQPAQLVQEKLHALLWPNQSLGRSLSGTLQTVEKMTRADLLAYRRQHYHAGNLWLAVAGKTDLHEVKKYLQPFLKRIAPRASSRCQPVVIRQKQPHCLVIAKPIEQSHVAIGLHGVSRHDPRRFAVKLLSVILGENMSSRLFQLIREKHGLAYSIHSSATYFQDTGCLSINAGLENGKFTRAVTLILREIKRLTQTPPSALELRRAKDYTIGQMHLSLESTTNQMMWLGEGVIGQGRVMDPYKVMEKIQLVTPEEIQAVAYWLAQNQKLNIAVISPSVKEAQVKEVARFV